jgi:RND family efflux transporter MFP subunit
MDVLRKVLRYALPLLVIAAGIGVRTYLVKTKPEPRRAEQEDRGALVEVMVATQGDHDVVLTAQGTVMPAQQVVLIPQVGGRILWAADELIPGGHFEEGAPLLRIDPRDYQIAVEQRAAELNRTRLEQQVETSRAQVARREWELFDDGGRQHTEEGRALALREPQLENAEVSVRAANSAVRRAQLDLRRTTLTAPFNAFVQAESVDVGQVVGPTSQLATLVGSDAFWVRVSVPVAHLAHVKVPGFNATEGSLAVVTHRVGEESVRRNGRVVRLYGDLDPAGQMARLLVEIQDPFGLQREEGEEGDLPLLLGSYVTVGIEATPVREAVEVPRYALREGEKVYVINGDDELEIRDVQVAWRMEDTVLITAGVRAGDRIITSRLSQAVGGMALRVEEEEQPDGAPRAEAQP